MAEENNWDKYFIHAISHKEAALLAAKKEWWLHCWNYVYDAEANPAYIIEREDYKAK